MECSELSQREATTLFENFSISPSFARVADIGHQREGGVSAGQRGCTPHEGEGVSRHPHCNVAVQHENL